MTELSLLAKATVVLALALAAARVARGAPASLRALVLSAAFCVIVALPVATMLVPARQIEIPIDYEAGAFPLLLVETEPAPIDIPLGRPSAPPAPARWTIPTPSAWLRGAWAAGLLIAAFPVCLALWRLRGIRRAGLPWLHGRSIVDALTDRAGVHRRVDVFLHEGLSAPMMCGVRRPAIGLPVDAPSWDATDLHRALVHELEHVRRGDWPVHLMTRLVCAVYWFHPLVWIAARQLSLESERACDDGVLRDAEQTQYAEQLVTLARRLSRRGPIGVLSMADRSDLSTRVRAVLDPRQRRGRVGTISAVAVVAVSTALTLAISSLEAVSRVVAAGSAQAQVQTTAIDRTGLTGVPVALLIVERAERPSSNDAPQAPAGARQLPAGAPQGLAAMIDSPTTGPDAPRFEVASIRRNPGPGLDRGGTGGGTTLPTGQVRTTNAPLVQLIRMAYGLRMTDLVVGVPAWANTDGFDVDAKPHQQVSVSQARLMLRTLLAERFKLVVRREARDLPIYALTLARTDGRLGPQIARPGGECVMVVPGFAQTAAGADATSPNPAGPAVQPALGQPGRRCGVGPDETGTMRAGSATMATLISLLTPTLDRPVVDRTGLTGLFDFDLRYARAGFVGPGLGGRGAGLSPQTAAEPAGVAPTIFTALQEQLGLKLETQRGPVDVLVIERAELPSEN